MVYGVKLENGTVIYSGGVDSPWIVIRSDGTHEYYRDPVVLIICECFGGEKLKQEL